jgi:CSLREA domain-containing protein
VALLKDRRGGAHSGSCRAGGRNGIAVGLAAAAALVLVGGGGAGRSSEHVIVVNSTLDERDVTPADGVCSALTLHGRACTLRAAVETANARRATKYVIVFKKEPAVAYTPNFQLSHLPGDLDLPAYKRDLDITTADLKIVGEGPKNTILDAAGVDRFFDVEPFSHLTLQNLTIEGGRPYGTVDKDGGGIRVAGTLDLYSVVLENNNARYGGAVYVVPGGAAKLTNTTLLHNVATRGAGIAVAGKAVLTNVTIVGNNSVIYGGGIEVANCNVYKGGALPPTCTVPGQATLLHVTITGNTGVHADAISLQQGTAFGMRGSIVAGACQFLGLQLFPGRNVLTSDTCGSDPVVADPGLLPLGGQRGAIPTVGLASSSPAIDFAFANSCPKVDARGFVRPIGAGCDSGAYEAGSHP